MAGQNHGGGRFLSRKSNGQRPQSNAQCWRRGQVTKQEAVLKVWTRPKQGPIGGIGGGNFGAKQFAVIAENSKAKSGPLMAAARHKLNTPVQPQTRSTLKRDSYD